MTDDESATMPDRSTGVRSGLAPTIARRPGGGVGRRVDTAHSEPHSETAAFSSPGPETLLAVETDGSADRTLSAPASGPRASRLGSACGFLFRWGAPALFVALAARPMIRRLGHPTLLGDDLLRVVDLATLSFRSHLFLSFSEHVAPLFQMVSWLTWNLIGQDIRLAPLAFSAASVLSWACVLALLGAWLFHETRSRTATAVALALVAQSPLVLESMWWYSSSSFLWAVSGIVLALLGSSWVWEKPRRGLVLVFLGAVLGPAGTSLGTLAAPLAILRGLIDGRASRRIKVLVVLVAAGGLIGYEQFCRVGDVRVFDSDRLQSKHRIDPVGGLGYTLTVPGRMLWPSAFGVPASQMAAPMSASWAWGFGLLALLGTGVLVLWPCARWDRRLVLVAAAMIYLTYGLTYSCRVSLLEEGYWTEPQLLYFFAGRYHVLPLLGVAATVAAVAASIPLVRRCDRYRGVPAALGMTLGLVMMFAQEGEAKRWDWMLEQPDQRATMEALHRLGEVARDEGITREQLLRVVAPIWRPWNGSVFHDRPAASHLASACVQAPVGASPVMSDQAAFEVIRARLTRPERMAIGNGACVFGRGSRPGPGAATLAVAREVRSERARETQPGRYHLDDAGAFVEYEIDSVTGARYLELPGLRSDQDLIVYWCGTPAVWHPDQNVHWFANPRPDATAVIDIDRLIQWTDEPISRIRIVGTGPGDLCLDAPPRLSR